MNIQPTLAIFGNISPYLSQSIVCEIKVQFSKYKTGQGTIFKYGYEDQDITLGISQTVINKAGQDWAG